MVRVQFAKVAEYQCRGLVHFHALIRLDGPPTDLDGYSPPAAEVSSSTLADLVVAAAAAVRFDAPAVDVKDVSRGLRFGTQIDARPVTGTADPDAHGSELHPETVAAYIAKYATKAAADLPTSQTGANAHVRQLRAVLRRLASRATLASLGGADEPYKGWGRWIGMLGFRGHLATKSRRYSVTLGRLRRARRDWTRRRNLAQRPGWADLDDQADLDDTTLVVGAWRFAGMGWLTAGDASLAAASAARARDG